jgi:hypothetical protein
MPGIPPAQPVSPWHMWGTTFQFERIGIAPPPFLPSNQATHQLARVNYRRPENWRFLLTGRITGGKASAVTATSVWAWFDLIVGVGRAFVTTERPGIAVTPATVNGFARMHWLIPAGTPPGQQAWNIKWITRTDMPLDDTDIAVRQVIEHFPAQDIQCVGHVFMNTSDPGITVNIELGAFFAPNVHVRPDWWQPAHRPGPHGDPMAAQAQALRFLGTETGGT